MSGCPVFAWVNPSGCIFFQAEAGIRDLTVTGVQTCALPIALACYIEGMTDQLRGSVVILEEGTLSPAHYRWVKDARDEYERELGSIIARGIMEEVFVPCDPRVVGFAILGAMNWIPKWYHPDGSRTGKEIADAFSSYLVRGLLRDAKGTGQCTST